MPAIIQHQLLGMKANVVSYNAIIDGVHAMGPHRLLATSGCDIGIEFLIVIVVVSFVFECCMSRFIRPCVTLCHAFRPVRPCD